MRRATPGRLAAGVLDSDNVGGFLEDGLAGCQSRGCLVSELRNITGFEDGLPDPS